MDGILVVMVVMVVMVFRFAQVMCGWGENRLGGSWAQDVCSSEQEEGGWLCYTTVYCP